MRRERAAQNKQNPGFLSSLNENTGSPSSLTVAANSIDGRIALRFIHQAKKTTRKSLLNVLKVLQAPRNKAEKQNA